MDVLERDPARRRRGARAPGRRRRPRRRLLRPAAPRPRRGVRRAPPQGSRRRARPRPTRTASSAVRRLDAVVPRRGPRSSTARRTRRGAGRRAASSGRSTGPRSPRSWPARRCLAVAGGHVGMLLRTMQFFSVRPPAELPVVAWSAGAMAMTRTVVLFNDFAQSHPCRRGLGPRARPGRRAHRAAARPPPDPARRPRADCRSSSGGSRGHACLLLDDGAKVAVGPDGCASGRRAGDPRRRHGRRGRGRRMTSPDHHGPDERPRSASWRSTGCATGSRRRTPAPSTGSSSGTPPRSSRAATRRSCGAARPRR